MYETDCVTLIDRILYIANGNVISYFNDGFIIHSTMKMGKFHGLTTVYRGFKVYDTMYKDDKKHGPKNIYNDNGECINTLIYDNDTLKSSIMYYPGNIIGRKSTFYPNGNLKEFIEYNIDGTIRNYKKYINLPSYIILIPLFILLYFMYRL